jgi:hypothetical protein
MRGRNGVGDEQTVARILLTRKKNRHIPFRRNSALANYDLSILVSQSGKSVRRRKAGREGNRRPPSDPRAASVHRSRRSEIGQSTAGTNAIDGRVDATIIGRPLSRSWRSPCQTANQTRWRARKKRRTESENSRAGFAVASSAARDTSPGPSPPPSR